MQTGAISNYIYYQNRILKSIHGYLLNMSCFRLWGNYTFKKSNKNTSRFNSKRTYFFQLSVAQSSFRSAVFTLNIYRHIHKFNLFIFIFYRLKIKLPFHQFNNYIISQLKNIKSLQKLVNISRTQFKFDILFSKWKICKSLRTKFCLNLNTT